MKKHFAVLAGVVAAGATFVALTSVVRADPATFVVTVATDTDDGTCDADCSLREAIDDANANAGADTILFDDAIAGETIALLSALPQITEEAIVDGTTLLETQDGPDIGIVGTEDAAAVLVFNNAGDENALRGVAIVTQGLYCVDVDGTNGLVIGGSDPGDGNWFDGDGGGRCIHLHADDGTFILGNVIGGQSPTEMGIDATDSTNLTVGGTDPDEKNIVVNNALYGMAFSGVSGLSVQGNWIGTLDGDSDDGNGSHGIFLVNVTDAAIGGTAAGAGNVISGNNNIGISISDDDDTGIVIQGNYIGLNADGDAALPNGFYGIYSASAVTIGGTEAGAGNVVSGNPSAQIVLTDAGATEEVPNAEGSTVQGNIIGLNAAGDAIIDGGDGMGILVQNSNNLIGGTDAGAGNVISGNVGDGIYVIANTAATEDNVIQGNVIGLDATGEIDFGNTAHGISLDGGVSGAQIGGVVAGARNVISGNALRGIFVSDAVGVTVEGNYIGTDNDGTTAIPNDWSGIEIQGDDNVVGGATADSRNVISGNTGSGITIPGDATGNVVTNNYIGTDVAGLAAVPNAHGVFFQDTASGNTIGGAGIGNLISGNGGQGIWVFSDTNGTNTVQGNYIGVDATGDAELSNVGSGINANSPLIIGGTEAGAGNVISGNDDQGIYLGGAGGSTVQGNMIGVNADGDAAIGNFYDGIMIASSDNVIGGTTAGARNVISGGNRLGINFFGFVATENNVVQGNYIGLNAAGDAALPNDEYGVSFNGEGTANNTLGGTVAGAGNVISGNMLSGINVEGDTGGETIAGNYIGLNAAGDAAVPNGGLGIRMNSDNNVIGGTADAARNVISGNAQEGIGMFGTSVNNTIENNYIGLNAAGDAAIGNAGAGISISNASTGNFIGVAGFGNVISGNNYRAIYLMDGDVDDTSIQGNIIGLAADGMTAMGNNGGGIVTVGASGTLIGTANDPAARNVISSSTNESGIFLSGGDHYVVVNNYIGVASDGVTLRPNESDGVRVENGASSNTIGGIAAGEGNVAGAAAGFDCYRVMSDAGDFTEIRGNSCVNEGVDGVLNVNREGDSNEATAIPVINEETSTTSYAEGTSGSADGEVDLFVNGLYVATADTDGSGNWSVAASFASGGMLSASVTNASGSTSSTTLQIALSDDDTAPALVSLSPADDAEGVANDANLALTFDETVVFGSGDIVIRKASNGSALETIDVNDADLVSGEGTTVVIVDPSEEMRSGTDYYVTVDATAFEDYSGNPFAGIADETSWSFSTEGNRGGGGSYSASPTYSVSVVSPAGGEELFEGDTLRIRWETGGTGTVGFVNLSYSAGGASYESIERNVPNDGSYDWRVTGGIDSDSVTVRVEATDLASVLAAGVSGAFSVGNPPDGAAAASFCPESGISDASSFPAFPDYFRGDSFSTVYYLNARGQRRPFPTSQTYLSWTDSFDGIVRVIDAVLPCYPLGIPVLPRPGRVLVKIVSNPNVYALESDPSDADGTILRLIPDEATAIAVYGSAWADYVIDVDPTLFHHFTNGTAIDAEYVVDLTKMKKRS